MPEFDAVVFDLDDTLCVHDQDDREIHEAVFDRAGREPFFEPADMAAVEPSQLPPADSDHEFYEHLYRAVADVVDADPGDVSDLAAATLEVIDHSQVSFRDGAEAALEYARDRYDVGLVTNGGEETQTTKLAALGIRDAFDAEVYCDPRTGVDPKPDPKPLELALADLGVAPDRAVNVGDVLTLDVEGAHNAGMAAAWVPTGEAPEDPDPEPEFLLDSMRDLPEVL